LLEKKKTTKKLLIAVLGLWLAILFGAIIIVVLVLNGYISLGAPELPGAPPLAKLENGSLANDFALENLNAEQVRLSDLRGKVVVVNFWATWCIPCVEEMPSFQEFQNQYPDFVMLGIDQEEGLEQVRTFLEGKGIDYQILLDYNAKVAGSYKVFMLPTPFFIDQEGMIRFRHYGIMTPDQMAYYLRTLGVIQ
jgi:cytochrome c biogenesis protein CcmG, thiol:disulfide interchange protein DsbE